MRKRCIYRKWVAVFCILALLCSLTTAAYGEDCFTLDVDTLDMNALNSNDYVAQYLSSSAPGIRVKKYISNSSELTESVRLTLTQMDTQVLVFDKDYGYQGKLFDSGVIYLPYVDNRTIPYLVTLYVGSMVYAMPFMQLQPRLSYNGACTFGVRLRDLGGGLSSDWLMGTMLDLNALNASGYTQLDLCASNAYVIGQALVTMQNGSLMVQLDLNPSANVEIHNLSLYVITDCASLAGDPAYMGYPSASIGEWVSVADASSALLYIPMQVSYDPMGLPTFGYDLTSGLLQNQLYLWDENRMGAMQPMETPPPMEALPPELAFPSIEPTQEPMPTDVPLVESAIPQPTAEPTLDPALQPSVIPAPSPDHTHPGVYEGNG